MSPKIHSRLWKDEDFWQLDAAGKVTFLWLITNGETNNCGHLVFSARQFTSDTGLDPKGVQNLTKALARALVVDGQNLWLRNYMRHQWSPGERGPNSKMWKGLVNAIASMPEALREECLREYPEFYAGVAAIYAPCKALTSPLQGPSCDGSHLQGPCKALTRGQSRAEQSRALSSSSLGGVGDAPPVELPPGFPETLQAAQAQSAMAGVLPEVVAEVWHEAMAAGGRDWRDRPIRHWSHHVRGESLRKGRLQKKPATNGHPAPSLGAEAMQAENRRRALLVEIEKHPANPDAAAYAEDHTEEETAGLGALRREMAAVEARLRSLPAEGPDWLRQLRLAAFQRELASHPGNPASAAYDEELCTERTREEYLALRREVG